MTLTFVFNTRTLRESSHMLLLSSFRNMWSMPYINSYAKVSTLEFVENKVLVGTHIYIYIYYVSYVFARLDVCGCMLIFVQKFNDGVLCVSSALPLFMHRMYEVQVELQPHIHAGEM